MGDIKGTFYPKMRAIKDINCRDLVDAEEIKKDWKEYMEELYKRTVPKKIQMNQMATVMWSATQSQTSWREVK